LSRIETAEIGEVCVRESWPVYKNDLLLEINFHIDADYTQIAGFVFHISILLCLFVFLALQPTVVVFSQPGSGL
jgi:hypothetical protein